MKRHTEKEEEIQLKEYNKVSESTDTSRTSVTIQDSNAKAEKEPKKINYFFLNKYENIVVLAACALLSYWLVSFSFTTQELHAKMKIDGVTTNSLGLNWDVSDPQWNSFITNMDMLLPVSIAFLLISKLIKTVAKSSTLIRVFNIVFGASMYLYLFRGGFLFWLFFTLINFTIVSTLYKSKVFPFLLWGFNIFLLFSNELNHGYDLVKFFHCDALQFIQDTRNDATLQWNVIYNMSMLRIISFGMDKYWAHMKFRHMSKEKHLSRCEECSSTCECLKERYEQYHPIFEYNLLNFFTYILYVPILITGPPITFNAFLSQLKSPMNTISLKTKLSYTLRTVIVFAVFLLWNHINFGFALITRPQNEHIWKQLGQKDGLQCVANTLVILWMKFNCLWKYSRCWALWDDMEVPENMNRCVFNNYNFEGFWRSWHRGFNQWLIRYVYLPCGGSKTKQWNIWVVFTFVAIWHDLNINLMVWAWGICLCLVPEILVKSYVQKPKFNKYTQNHYWKYFCCFVAGMYSIWLQFTNLVGFGMGYQTYIFFFKRAFSSVEGIIDIVGSYIILSIVELKNMEIREKEEKNY